MLPTSMISTLDGTEARHAEDLNKTIYVFINSERMAENFLIGFNRMLEELSRY